MVLCMGSVPKNTKTTEEFVKISDWAQEHRASVANLDRKTSALQVELVESKERWEQLQDEEKEWEDFGFVRRPLFFVVDFCD